MEVKQVLHMKGGEGNLSYAKNSSRQRFFVLNAKSILKETVEELLYGLGLQAADCLRIAELGCSSGPNALIGVEHIIANISKVCNTQNLEKHPSIQIFLNDLEGNDFNIIFKSLPEFYGRLENFKSSSCFVAAMPGSFYCRLFPSRSIHLANSSNSLQWLSQVPSGLVTKSGEYLNKSHIHIAKTSLPEVHKAYFDQFEKDFTLFLKLRSEELVSNGHLVLTMVSKNDDDYFSNNMLGLILPEMGLILHEMINEGLVNEAKLDSFNLPLYCASAKEIKDIIEKEGSFKIHNFQTFERMWSDIFKEDTNKENGCSGNYITMSIRAVFEPILASHFGKEIMDEVFKRCAKRITHYMEFGQGSTNSVVVSLVNNANVG